MQITAIGGGINRATTETYWDSNWNVVSSPVMGGFAGYYWGNGGTKRWGTNNITQAYGTSADDGNGITDAWETTFSATGGSNEMQAGTGDSGGGVFYKRGSTWEFDRHHAWPSRTFRGQPWGTAVFDDATFFADLSQYAGEITRIMASPATVLLVR